MKSKNFCLGIGLGIVLGMAMCCCKMSAKSKEAAEWKKRLLEAGTKVADKAAEKVEEMKDKAHSLADEMKK